MKFTLKDVVSNRILDPVIGWRDRLPEEQIILTDEQKEAFVKEFGHGCRVRTKASLKSFINNPKNYADTNWWLERMQWVGDRWIYYGGQSCTDEIATIRKLITGNGF